MEKVITILGDMLEGIDLLFKDVLVFFGFASAEPSSPVDPSLSPASAELKDPVPAPVPDNVAEVPPPLPAPIALTQMPVLTTQGGLVSVMDLADSKPEVFSLAQSKGASITLGEAPEFGMNNISIPPSIPHIIFVSGAGDYAATISPDFTIRGNDPGASGRTVYLFDSVDNSEFVLRGQGVVGASGQWAVELSGLQDALHVFRASFFKDGSSPSDPFFLSVDASPVVAGIEDTGIVGDHITKLEPGSTISGASSLNATLIELSLNGSILAQVSPVNGVWSLTLPSEFPDGTLQVIEKDAFGYAQNSESFVIDNTALPPVINNFNFDLANPLLSGLGEPGSTIHLYKRTFHSSSYTIDSTPTSTGIVNQDGQWSLALPSYLSSPWSAKQVDVAGNESDYSFLFNKLLPLPTVTAISYSGANITSVTVRLPDLDSNLYNNMPVYGAKFSGASFALPSNEFTYGTAGGETVTPDSLSFLRLFSFGNYYEKLTITFAYTSPGGLIMSEPLVYNSDPRVPFVASIADSLPDIITVNGTGGKDNNSPLTVSGVVASINTTNNQWTADILKSQTDPSFGEGVYGIHTQVGSNSHLFIMGNQADNRITIDNPNFQKVDGGAGSDTLVLGSGLDELSFTSTRAINNIETIQMKARDVVKLNLFDLLDINSGHEVLFAGGGPDAKIELSTGGVGHSTSTSGGGETTYSFFYQQEALNLTVGPMIHVDFVS